jgi:hypothetical protein
MGQACAVPSRIAGGKIEGNRAHKVGNRNKKVTGGKCQGRLDETIVT